MLILNIITRSCLTKLAIEKNNTKVHVTDIMIARANILEQEYFLGVFVSPLPRHILQHFKT